MLRRILEHTLCSMMTPALVLSICAWAVTPRSVGAEGIINEESQNVTAESPFGLRLSISRDAMLPYEAFYTSVTLCNISGKDITTTTSFAPRSTFLHVADHRGDGERFRPLCLGRLPTYSSKPRWTSAPVKAKYSRSVRAYTLLHEMHRFDDVILTPGTLRITATARSRDRERHIVSNTVTLTILEPTGPDKEAYEYIRECLQRHGNDMMSPSTSFRGLFHLAGSVPASAEANPVREDFINRFPGSTYADYARMALGNTLLKAPETHDRGLHLLLQVAGNPDVEYLDFVLKDAVLMYLREERVEEAISLLRVLHGRNSASPETMEAWRRIISKMLDTHGIRRMPSMQQLLELDLNHLDAWK